LVAADEGSDSSEVSLANHNNVVPRSVKPTIARAMIQARLLVCRAVVVGGDRGSG
jgi:hypothetical protein